MVLRRGPSCEAGRRHGRRASLLEGLRGILCDTNELPQPPCLMPSLSHSLVASHVLLPLFTVFPHQVKHIDQYAHRTKDLVPLTVEIAVHVALLAPTVPQIQDEVSQEANMGMLDIKRLAQSLRVPCLICRAVEAQR